MEDVVRFVKDADPQALGPHVELFRKHVSSRRGWLGSGLGVFQDPQVWGSGWIPGAPSRETEMRKRQMQPQASQNGTPT